MLGNVQARKGRALKHCQIPFHAWRSTASEMVTFTWNLYSTGGRRRPKAPAKSSTRADGPGEQGRDGSRGAKGRRRARGDPEFTASRETCAADAAPARPRTVMRAACAQSRQTPANRRYSRACAAWGGGRRLLSSR